MTNNFTATDSPDWKFYYEIQPVGSNVQGQVTQARWSAVAQAVSGRISGGAMRLGRLAIQLGN